MRFSNSLGEASLRAGTGRLAAAFFAAALPVTFLTVFRGEVEAVLAFFLAVFFAVRAFALGAVLVARVRVVLRSEQRV
jgi:hypothetical protein